MTSPLRKLVRIAFVLLSFALLLNFFGYYFVYTKSQENEKLVQVISLAGRQAMLSQSINKNIILLCNTPRNNLLQQQVKDTLRNTLADFDKTNKFLHGEILIEGLP